MSLDSSGLDVVFSGHCNLVKISSMLPSRLSCPIPFPNREKDTHGSAYSFTGKRESLQWWLSLGKLAEGGQSRNPRETFNHHRCKSEGLGSTHAGLHGPRGFGILRRPNTASIGWS